MNRDTAIVEIRIPSRKIDDDLEVPADISVSELILSLDSIYSLGLDRNNLSGYCIKCHYPIRFLHGSMILGESGVRNGSVLELAAEGESHA